MLKKRAISLLLALVVLMSITACSGGNSNNSSESNDKSKGQFKTNEIKLPDYKVTNSKVSILTWANPNEIKDPNLWLYSFNEKLKSQYNCEMNIIYTTQQDIGVKASQLVLSGKSPDLIAYQARNNPNFVINNVVQPWDEYVDFNEPVFKDLKDINDKYRINGKIYPIITNWLNQGYTYYWTEDLQDLGLESPRDLYKKGEWTWSKAAEYANLLQKKSSDGTVTRYGIGYDCNLMHVVTGQTFVSKNGSVYKNNLRNSKLADFFNYTSKLTDTSCVFPKNVNMLEQFQSHKVSLYIAGRDIVDNRMFEEQKTDQIMFAPSPRWDGTDKYYAPGRISGIWLAKGAQNIEGACAYIAIWHLLVGEIDDKITDAVHKLATAVRGHTQEDYELMAEMSDPNKFELLIPEDEGLGVNWSTTQRITFLNELVNNNKSWATQIEQYSPLLDAGIKEASDGLKKVNS